MKKLQPHLWHLTAIGIAALILVLDLFLHPGEPAAFDSQIHITNIASFYTALKQGDFPVTWAGTFANYGLPTPLVSQQLTSYTGAWLTFLTHDPLMSYKILMLLGALFGSLSMYLFLSSYASPNSALAGTLLFNFSAYRIFNLYVRGALPEFVALGFIPLLLYLIRQLFRRRRHAALQLTLATTLLILTHPFIFVVSLFITVPYLVYQYISSKQWCPVLLVGTAWVIALLLTAWYTLPLVKEMKYFVIGQNQTQLADNQFLSLTNYLSNAWPYVTDTDIFVRGNLIPFGLIETVILLVGLGLFYKSKTKPLLIFSYSTALLLIFLTTSWSLPLYRYLPYLNGIQFPWRMLSALLCLPPFILAIGLDRLPQKSLISIIAIGVMLVTRVPQVYGKNFTVYPPDHYWQTVKNLHFDSLNTVWTGNTATYPVKSQKGDIVEGQGTITARTERNSWREYRIEAATKVRMADYTFYFPGWTVYVDGQPVEIQFQDPNYRGVITYHVPAGNHQVKVVFEPTKIRRYATIISLSTLVMVLGYIVKTYAKSTAHHRHHQS